MGNSASAQPRPNENNPNELETQKYQKIVEGEKLMEKMTRFRWKLEESKQGIDFEAFAKNQEIVTYLKQNNKEISQILSISNSQISQDKVDTLINLVISVQAQVYHQIFIDGIESLLLEQIEKVILNIKIIQTHLVENVSSYPSNRLIEIETIRQTFSDVMFKIKQKINLFKGEFNLKHKEKILKSFGKLFNQIRDQIEQTRNVICKYCYFF